MEGGQNMWRWSKSTNIKSLCCTYKTNTVLYVNYISILISFIPFSFCSNTALLCHLILHCSCTPHPLTCSGFSFSTQLFIFTYLMILYPNYYFFFWNVNSIRHGLCLFCTLKYSTDLEEWPEHSSCSGKITEWMPLNKNPSVFSLLALLLQLCVCIIHIYPLMCSIYF